MTRFAPVVSETSVYYIAHVIPGSRTVLRPALPTDVGRVVRRRGSDGVVSQIAWPAIRQNVRKLSVFDLVYVIVATPVGGRVDDAVPVRFAPDYSVSLEC